MELFSNIFTKFHCRFHNKKKVCFSFFFLWHINLHRLFNAKAILVKEQWRHYLSTYLVVVGGGGIRRFMPFPRVLF